MVIGDVSQAQIQHGHFTFGDLQTSNFQKRIFIPFNTILRIEKKDLSINKRHRYQKNEIITQVTLHLFVCFGYRINQSFSYKKRTPEYPKSSKVPYIPIADPQTFKLTKFVNNASIEGDMKAKLAPFLRSVKLPKIRY